MPRDVYLIALKPESVAAVVVKSGTRKLQNILKLTPLGDPASDAPKLFAAVEMIRLAGDEDRLHKATKEISKYWRNKRGRRLTPQPLSRST